MKFAVFFRNLNLGQPPAPTRLVLEAAFAGAGAIEPSSFLTNGTLVFQAPHRTAARRMLAAAQATLARDGFNEPAALQPLDELVALVDAGPFADLPMAQGGLACATFFTARHEPDNALPELNAKGDVKVVAWRDGLLLSLAYQRTSSYGDPNSFVERCLGVPATTRVWNTVVRLVAKHRGT